MNKPTLKHTILNLAFSGLIFCSFITAGSTLIQQTYAQEESNTKNEATQSASLANIKQIIKENIAKSKVKGAIDNLLNRKVAVIGQVSRITDETVTITNRLGTRIVPLGDAVSILKDGKPIKSSEIAVENWVSILGRIRDDDFSPVFVYVYTKSLLPKSQFVRIGTITTLTKTSITIKPRSGEEEKIITLSKATEFEDLSGVEITLADLSEDLTILVSGVEAESKVEATTIRSLAPITDTESDN